ITHCRLASENCRSAWACGRAMFTMVASRTTISWAMPMKASAFQRCGSSRGLVADGAWGTGHSGTGAWDRTAAAGRRRSPCSAGARWVTSAPAVRVVIETTRVLSPVAGPAVRCTDRAPHAGRGRPSLGSVDADELRAEVRDFLVTRRGRITPGEAGLPVYGGLRRVSGLRREELAMLAGLSVEYYARLERG